MRIKPRTTSRTTRPTKPPCWNADTESALVLMEYLKRASPEYVAAQLEALELLTGADAVADAAAAAIFEDVAPDREYMNLVGHLSENGVALALRELGHEPDRLDAAMAAILQKRNITCRDAATAPLRRQRTSLWPSRVFSVLPQRVALTALAICALIIGVEAAAPLDSLSSNDMGQFSRLAGPTPEW